MENAARMNKDFQDRLFNGLGSERSGTNTGGVVEGGGILKGKYIFK